MRYLFLSILLLSLLISVKAQRDDGLLVLLNGDTLNGTFDLYQPTIYDQFIFDVSGKSSTFKAGEFKEMVHLASGIKYISKQPHYGKGLRIIREVFSDQDIRLYGFNLKREDIPGRTTALPAYYYLLEKGGKSFVLEVSEIMKAEKAKRKDSFIGTLAYVFRDWQSKVREKKLREASLNDVFLTEFISTYLSESGRWSQMKTEQMSLKRKNRHSISGILPFAYSNENENMAFSIGAGYRYNLIRGKKISCSIGVDYFRSNYRVPSTPLTEYIQRRVDLRIPFTVGYEIFRNENLKADIFGEFSWMRSIFRGMVSGASKFKKTSLGTGIGISVTRNKVLIALSFDEATWVLPSSYEQRFIFQKSRLLLRAGYIL